jgi:hypothetical protein
MIRGFNSQAAGMENANPRSKWGQQERKTKRLTGMERRETFPLDIDPGQIVRWLKAETEGKPADFNITARRARETREIPLRREIHFGDAEREDLTEVATIATLEVAPARAGDGWLLTVVVEDELGPRMLDEGEPAPEEQPISLATFYSEFIRPGRGNAYAMASADGPAARGRLTRLLNAIEQDRHSGPRRAPLTRGK